MYSGEIRISKNKLKETIFLITENEYLNRRICSFDLKQITVPLKTAFTITGSSQNDYNGLFVKLIDASGNTGVGECCPLAGATHDNLIENFSFLPLRCKELQGLLPLEGLGLLDDAWTRDYGAYFEAGMCCLEMAMLDLHCHQEGILLQDFLRSGVNSVQFCQPKISCDITVPALSETEVRKFLDGLVGYGFESFKVKVTGMNIDEDLNRVLVTNEYVPKGGQLTLDGNQGFDAAMALDFVQQLKLLNVKVALFEQPHPKHNWDEFVTLAESLEIPICLDESIKKIKDLEKAIGFHVPFWLNLKIMKSGVRETFRLGIRAKELGIGLMIGGMVESDVAMSCSLHVLGALGGVDIVDLDTPFFMTELICQNSPYRQASANLSVPSVGSGLGLVYLDKFLGPKKAEDQNLVAPVCG